MVVSSRTAGRGRRPGPTRTREAILDAARRRFGAGGYDRTSLRAIAGAAGVDQALIAHFFGSKMGLFIEAVELPIDLETAIGVIESGPRAGVGERVATLLVTALENRDTRSIVTALVRAAASEPEAARLVRERMTHELWGPLARRLDVDQADLRVSLVGTQILGLVLARYVVRVEPLASMPPPAVVSLIAPTVQRYLVDPL